MKYRYPAIFYEEAKGIYFVEFPDIKGAFTSGDSLANAIAKAEDILSIQLNTLITEGKNLPKPSAIDDIVPKYSYGYQIIIIDSCEPENYWNNLPFKSRLINAWLSVKNRLIH